MSNKVHAKDYLSEWSNNKPEWLKILIKEAIDTNGDISEKRRDEIFAGLLNNTPLQEQTVPSSSVQQTSQKILFESLTHVSGVNALCENQMIRFSPDVTVLYGLNGSGKSGYFRILNNISGGVHKEIKPNIYANEEDRKRLNVSVKYKRGNTSKEQSWTDANSTIQELNGVKVFDSSYLNGLLQIKNPDETVVYPLGLHLFNYIANILDSFTLKLTEQANTVLQSLPVINTEDLTESIKTKFNNRGNFSATEKNSIKESFTFSDTDANTLTEKEKELKQLQQNNFQDTIRLLTKDNKELSSFVDKINALIVNLKTYEKELGQALVAYETAKKNNNEARQRLEILNLLPKSDTPEWKSFIKAGHEYSSLLESETPERCPYCHQELRTDEAINLVSTYAVFLQDSSEKELDESAKALAEIRGKIEKLDDAILLTDEIKKLFAESAELERKIGQLSENKKILLSANNKEGIQLFPVNLSEELKIIAEKQNEIKKTIDGLNASQAEKDKKVAELQKAISILKERKSIFEQKSNIEKYFSIYDRLDGIEAKKSGTKTNQITALANQAQRELLTDALKSKFESELKALGREKLKVQLEVINGSKGKCNTRLKLIGDNSVTEILSEGEQKAVGLAMFFAEIQNDNYPIILDDPVTSLDHEIAGLLAKRLLDFSNQVIVFCHNKLFLDGFETSKTNHVCKNFISCGHGSNKGKHIFIYQIYGDGHEKGILLNYRGDDSNSLIAEINKRLSKRPFTDNYGVAILLRRAVEKIIDEDVFKYLLPPRVSNKNNRINWDELKNINSKPQLVERLRIVHDATSEEDHVGTASIENPISVDKLKELAAELVQIKKDFRS